MAAGSSGSIFNHFNALLFAFGKPQKRRVAGKGELQLPASRGRLLKAAALRRWLPMGGEETFLGPGHGSGMCCTAAHSRFSAFVLTPAPENEIIRLPD